MSQVSRIPLSQDAKERIFLLFIKTVLSLNGRDEAEQYIFDVFTPAEKVMVSKRIAIAFLLIKKYEYREISKMLSVSSATVAFVNATLVNGKGGYKQVLNKVMNEEHFEELMVSLSERLLAIPASMHKGSGVWKYLHKEVQKQAKRKRPTW